MKNSISDYWDSSSDKWYRDNTPSHEIVKENPKMGFPIDVYPILKKYLGNLNGKKILVPSSGDNVAVFAFHLLGAQVTSCDFSELQIKNAKKIAKANGWNIEFNVQDTMILDEINDNEFDLVYTSNGTHVWISDMTNMYRNINRVLKNGGYSIFFETHPMSRPFDNTTYDIKIKQHYSDVYISADDTVPNYLWRTQDFVNAITFNGFTIKEMLEFHSHREDLISHNYLYVEFDSIEDNTHWPGDTFDWKNNPWAALPQCLCLCSQKAYG
ncbi:MAG: class I SAM-dependent methyltransferase [Defluviitaleaceae bacterium]|nr:class I SAM-dependent methyltransferase [Defluviitaleaceae bacterium]